MHIGDRVTLDIGPIAHGGHFVARHEGRVIFVRHAITGEKVVAEIIDISAKLVRANAVEIITPSPHRVAAPCKYSGAGACGGCDFQHIDLAYQRELKAFIIKEQFERIAKKTLEITVEAVAPENGFGWRTRMDFTTNNDRKLALFTARSHRLIEVDKCLIADPRINIPAINAENLPTRKRVDVAISSSGKTIVAVEGRTSMDLIDEKVKGRDFAISPSSFWQSHKSAPSLLTEIVLEYANVGAGDYVFDLYGGVGLFSAALADQVGITGRVTLVELDEGAIADARRIFADLIQVDVKRGRVDKVLQNYPRADVIVLDPPRSGAGKGVVDAMVLLAPRAIVYVACDPSALARDTAYLADAGYQLAGLRAFDLFPMTAHIECVARFIPSHP